MDRKFDLGEYCSSLMRASLVCAPHALFFPVFPQINDKRFYLYSHTRNIGVVPSAFYASSFSLCHSFDTSTGWRKNNKSVTSSSQLKLFHFEAMFDFCVYV